MKESKRDLGSDVIKEKGCFRCGKELPPGSLYYVIHVRVFSGFDGFLIEPEEGVDKQLRPLLEQIQSSDPEDLEKEVYEEILLVVCKRCRDRLVDEIKHPWEGPFQIQKDPDHFLH